MAILAGIIHPFFNITDEMLPKLSSALGPSYDAALKHGRYKNAEVGVWQGELVINEKKTVWAGIDGAFQNENELKSELKKLGYPISSPSTAELLLFAYDAWKENYLNHLKGSFSFFLLDEEKEMLFLARDRLGQKNLYWFQEGEFFGFSTEIKGILATGLLPKIPSVIGFSSYFSLGYIPQDFSPVKNIHKLLPGHFLKVNLKKQLVIESYWSLSEQLNQKKQITVAQYKDEFEKSFQDALMLSVSSPGNKGLYLTNTIGSKFLENRLQKASKKDNLYLFTFNIDQAVNVSNGNVRQITITPQQLLSDFTKIVWLLDEPIANFHAVKLFYLSEAAQFHVETLLTDLGSFECFVKELQPNEELSRKLSSNSFEKLILKMPYKLLSRFFFPLLKKLRIEKRWSLLRQIESYPEMVLYLEKNSFFKKEERKKATPFLYPYFTLSSFVQRFHQLAKIKGSFDPFLYLNYKTTLPDGELGPYLRLLTPYQIRVVSPFLEEHFLQFISHVPQTAREHDAIYEEKVALKIEDKLPDEWLNDPGFRETFSLLEKGLLVEENFVSKKWILTLIRKQMLSQRDFQLLWAILSLEVWFKLNIESQNPIMELNLDVRNFLKK